MNPAGPLSGVPALLSSHTIPEVFNRLSPRLALFQEPSVVYTRVGQLSGLAGYLGAKEAQKAKKRDSRLNQAWAWMVYQSVNWLSRF